MIIPNKTSNGLGTIDAEVKMMSERVLYIAGEINDESAWRFSNAMMILNKASDDPITVIIDSPGGEINAGLLMYDAITGSKAPVRMICWCMAYSMAAVIFACAKERLILPNSKLMIHQPLLGGSVTGNASSIRSISDSLLETKAQINRLLALHTGKTEAEIDEATSYNHYYSATEAVEANLADRVISFSEMGV